MSHELAPIKPLLTRLHSNGRLRVWSVVVSIFGDLLQPRQQPVSVQELLILTGALGIEENALRTALSRLAKEGWVERHKRGRLAYYALSESGRHMFLAASERIYHHAFTSASSDWFLASFNPDVPVSERAPTKGLSLTKHWQLINEEDIQNILGNEHVMLFKAEAKIVPDWALNEMLPPSITRGYEQLVSDLKQLVTSKNGISTLSPLCAMTARILLIHAWRRLVLRHPLMPQGLLAANWPGALCHQQICTLYPSLIAQAETWWEEPTCAKGWSELLGRFNKQ